MTKYIINCICGHKCAIGESETIVVCPNCKKKMRVSKMTSDSSKSPQA